jgi:phosphoribosylpyrophosphate synthetase
VTGGRDVSAAGQDSMKVFFMCGFYPDAAHARRARTQDYWDAYRFCRAVRTGAFEAPFHIHTQKERILVGESNIGLARRAYGQFIVKRLAEEGSWSNPLLVPVPSEDAFVSVSVFRSWLMLTEALASTELKWTLVDALFWDVPPPAHVEHAARGECDALAAAMTCEFPVRGQAIVLIDDLVSTGTILLAARQRLQAEGAVVLGAVACGHVVHDFTTKAFGRQELWLDEDGTAEG